MNIGQRIFYLLEIQEKKQSELAKFTGIATTTINSWKSKNTNPSSDKIIRISEFFNVSPLWLLTGDGNPKQELQSNQQENTFLINKESPEKTTLIKVYSLLDEKKQYILLQKALELLNEENSATESSKIVYPLQTEIKAVGRDGRTQTIKFSEEEAIKHQKFLEENNPELAVPRKPKKF